jgi:geranylgeranyl diphosphate synthase type I
MQTSADLRSELGEVSTLLESHLCGFFQQNSERYAYGELFEPLYLDLSEFVCRKGKRIRPLLFLLGYRVFGGERSFRDPSLLKAAISVELLHAFILMHDDIIDRAERRRGLPTFHKLVEERLGKPGRSEDVGKNVALVVGDMLFALAVETLHATDFSPEFRQAALSRFLHYVSDTGCGEIYDILLGARDVSRVSEEEITRMYTLKTTRYTFEAPLVLGGILAGAAPDLLTQVEPFTDPLGLAFQIQNDLQEYNYYNPDDISQQTDLLEGKKTLLLRHAYERLSELDRSFLQLCLATGKLNDSSVLKIRELIDKSGAIPALRQKTEQLFAQAATRLREGQFGPAQHRGLEEAIDFIRGQTQHTDTG